MGTTIDPNAYIVNALKLILVCIFLAFVYLIYVYIVKPRSNNLYERFSVQSQALTFPDTIYETSLKQLYSNNSAPALLCNLLINARDPSCATLGRQKFPVHIIKYVDGSILSVFNDGGIYRKENMKEKMWYGPLDNSMPENGTIPLRMITIAPSSSNLLGVGVNGKLYIKTATTHNAIADITSPWTVVANNNNLIYVLTDPISACLIGINTDGKILIKKSEDLTSEFQIATYIQKPVLRLYFDSNGYMLVIDANFRLYQFTDMDWRNSAINYDRGANPMLVNDIIYDNDGKLYGLVFISGAGVLEVMKQSQIYYLSEFVLPEIQLSVDVKPTYLMNDVDLIKAKTGVDIAIIDASEGAEDGDQDENVGTAVFRQSLENKKKIREFCANRTNSDPNNINKYNDFELADKIEQNDNRISTMGSIISDLLKYDPESQDIKDVANNLMTLN